jgi:hypothetical protein
MPVPAVWIPLHTSSLWSQASHVRPAPRAFPTVSAALDTAAASNGTTRLIRGSATANVCTPPAGKVIRRNGALVSPCGPGPAQWWRAPPAPMVRQRAGATAVLWAACHGTTPARYGLDHAQVCGRCGHSVGCIAMDNNKTRPSQPFSVAMPCERYRRAMVPMRQRMCRLWDRTHRPLYCV